jgi:HEAT repeat protein
LVGGYAGDSDPRARSYAMVAAGRIGRPALGVALGGLDDAVPLVRQAAAWAACHGGEEAFDPIAKLLRDERELAVLEAALANLWRLGERPWEAEAARFAGHAEPGLRRAAPPWPAAGDREAGRCHPAGDVEPVIGRRLAGLADGPVDAADRSAVLAASATPTGGAAAAADSQPGRDRLTGPAAGLATL